MDLVALDGQLRAAERDLAEETRLGELTPSPFVALRCERLHRTVSALRGRRARVVAVHARGQAHVVPAVGGAPPVLASPRPAGRSWAGNDENAAPAGALPAQRAAPAALAARAPERWGDGGADGTWEWNGRAVRVVKRVLQSDEALLRQLLLRANALEERLGPKAKLTAAAAGEALGAERVRAREAARSQLQLRAKQLRHEIEHNSALAVQASFRGHLGRKMFRDARKKYEGELAHERASRIQAAFRGHRARGALRRGLAAEREQLQHGAAQVIQSQWRGRVARSELRAAKTPKQRQKAAAQLLQAWWRGCLGRAEVATARARFVREAEEQAALMLQCAWRGGRAARELARLKAAKAEAYAEAAAVMVQAAFRGHQARKAMRARRAELRDVDGKLASMAHADRIKTALYAKKFLDAKHRAAVTIQALARSFRERRRLARLRGAQGAGASARRAGEDAAVDALLRGRVVFEAQVRVPLEGGKAPALADLRCVVREVAQPYQLRLEAEEAASRTLFRRRVDLGALEQLLAPIFRSDERLRSEDKPMRDWVLRGRPPRRRVLIEWLLQRMWLEQAPGGALELCLGSESHNHMRATVQRLDKSLTAALAPTSPEARRGNNVSSSKATSPKSASPRPASPRAGNTKASAGEAAKAKPAATGSRTRDAFVVRYATQR